KARTGLVPKLDPEVEALDEDIRLAEAEGRLRHVDHRGRGGGPGARTCGRRRSDLRARGTRHRHVAGPDHVHKAHDVIADIAAEPGRERVAAFEVQFRDDSDAVALEAADIQGGGQQTARLRVGDDAVGRRGRRACDLDGLVDAAEGDPRPHAYKEA